MYVCMCVFVCAYTLIRICNTYYVYFTYIKYELNNNI